MPLPTPLELIAAALECSQDSLNEHSGLARHPQWDSLGHLRIMMALEDAYGISITDASIREFETFSAILAAYALAQKSAG
ncbi:MAG: acyl carrier protein [Alphaproteobacteria bacterium]|nr:acyl carrier protein [Alphaproteobacteria bacterium]